MSTTIDNRVVKMTFDNAQFQKGIKDTIKSLTDFESKLNFKGATAGFDKIKEAANKLNFANLIKKSDDVNASMTQMGKSAEENFNRISKSAGQVDFSKMGENANESFNKITQSANNVDMSGIGNNAQDAMMDVENAIGSLDMSMITHETAEAAEGFNAFSIIAVGALLEVGNKITDLVTGGLSGLVNGIKGLADAALFQPIKDGFQEYQTQMGAIQTILANTGRDFHSASDIGEVNAALDELNTYADKTIYNFTEMTKNIGTFTAAGVSMEEAVPAIQGIANLAALSGSTSQQASTAMYQLSQALSAGTVKLMDWNSVVNAGMGGEVFRNKLTETAKHIYSVNEGYEFMSTIVDDVIEGNISFRDSLEDGWLTSEVLTEALIQMTYAENDMTASEIAAARAHLITLGYTDEEIEAVFKLGQTAMESATKVRTWSQLWDTVGEALGSGWTTTWRTIIGDFQEATNLFTYLSNEITNVVGAVDNARNALVQGWADWGGRDLLFGTYSEDEYGRLVVVTNGILQNVVDAIKGWVAPISDAFSDVFNIFGLAKDRLQNENYDPGYAKLLKKSTEEAEAYRQNELNSLIEQFGEDSEEFAIASAELENTFNHTRELFDEGVFNDIDPETFVLDEVSEGLVSLTDGFRHFTESLIPSQEAMTGLRRIFEGVFSIIKVGLTVLGALFDVFASLVEIVRIFLDPIVDLGLYIGGTLGKVISILCEYIVNTVTAFRDFFHEIVDRVKPALKAIVDGFLGLLDIPGKIEIVLTAIELFLDAIWEVLGIPGKIRALGNAFGTVFDSLKAFLFGTQESAEGAGDAIEGVVQKIGNFFSGIVNSIYNTFPPIREFVDNIKNFYSLMRGDNEEEKYNYIKQKIEEMANAARNAIQPFVNLKNALGDFFNRVIEYIKNLDFFKEIINNINGFKDSIIGFIKSIPSRIPGFGSLIKQETDKAKQGFSVFQEIQKIADYFSTVTVEQFIQDAQKLKDEFVNRIVDGFNFIKNLNVDQITEYMKDRLSSVAGWFEGVGSNIYQYLISRFPQYTNEIQNGWNAIHDTTLSGIRGLNHLIEESKNESDGSVLDFIITLFKKISDTINEEITNLINAIGNIKISDIISTLIKPLELLRDFLKEHFPGLSALIEVLINSLSGFRDKMDDAGTTIGDVVSKVFNKLLSILETVAPQVMTWIDKIGEVFGGLPDSILSGIKWVSTALSHLPGVFGTIFRGLSSIITGYKIATKANAEEMPEAYDQMFEGAQTESEEAGDALGDFFSKFDPSNIAGSLRGMGGVIVEQLKSHFGEVKEYIKSLPDKLKELLQWLSSQTGDFKGLIDNAKEIVEGVLMVELGNFIKNIGSAINNYTKYLKAKETNDFSEKIRNIGIAIAAVAGVVAILSQIPQEDIDKGLNTVLAIGALLTAMEILPSLIEKVGKIDDIGGGEGVMKAALGILIVSIAMNILLGAIKEYQSTNIGELAEGFVRIVGGISALLFVMKKLGTAETMSAGAGVLLLAASMVVLSYALKKMSEALTDSEGNLSDSKRESLVASLVAVAALIGGFYAISQATSELDLVATASSLAIFGASLVIMAFAIGMLANNVDVPQLEMAAAALGALIIALSVLVSVTNEGDFMLTSASLIVFGAALMVMALALCVLATIPVDAIKAGAIALGALVFVFSVMAAILSAIGEVSIPVLLAMAAAFAAVGIAAVLIAQGIGIAVDAFIRMSEASSTIATFIQMVADNLQNFLMAAGAFVALGAGMLVLAVGMGVLGIAIGVFGVACMLAAGGIALIVIALNGFLDLVERFQEFVNAGTNITEGIGQGISQGGDIVTQAILGIAQTILNAILGFFGIHSPSDLMAQEVGQNLPAGIAEGIDSNSGSMLDSLGTNLDDLLGKFTNWVETDGLPKLQGFGGDLLNILEKEILPNISNWVQTEGIPALCRLASEAVSGIFGEANQLPEKLFLMATGIPANVWDGIKGCWGDLINTGSEIVNGIVEGIQSMPNAIADAVVGLAGDGLDGIKNFFGIQSPSKLMRDEVGKYIPLGLAAGIDKYAEVAIDSAIAMAESTANGIYNNLDADDMFGDIPSSSQPHIKPVLDMNSTWDDLHSYMNTFNGVDLTAAHTNLQNITADLNLSSLSSSMVDQSRKLADLTSQNEKLITEMNSLRSDMAMYTDAINNSAIVMDSGALVGSITPQMDKALGRRQNMARRGVY